VSGYSAVFIALSSDQTWESIFKKARSNIECDLKCT